MNSFTFPHLQPAARSQIPPRPFLLCSSVNSVVGSKPCKSTITPMTVISLFSSCPTPSISLPISVLVDTTLGQASISTLPHSNQTGVHSPSSPPFRSGSPKAATNSLAVVRGPTSNLEDLSTTLGSSPGLGGGRVIFEMGKWNMMWMGKGSCVWAWGLRRRGGLALGDRISIWVSSRVRLPELKGREGEEKHKLMLWEG